jgi:hypothetical protein
MKHDLSPRAQVVALKQGGHSQRQAASIIGKPLSFVERWWNADGILDRHGGGKPFKLTRSTINTIKKRLKKKTRTSTRQLAQAMGMSQTVIVRGAKLAGIRPYHRAKKFILTHKQQQGRLAWARRYKDQVWDKVLFTDEKIVWCITKRNSKNDIIWADKGDPVPPAPYDRHPAKLNVSAAVHLNGRSDIFIFDENLASPLYIQILSKTVLKEGAKIPGGGWELYLDNDPKHKSKMTTAFLAEKHVRVLPPAAKMPDTNIIENIWPMLDQELAKMGRLTKSNLRQKIKTAWKKIPQNFIRNCVLSMPHRLELIRKAKGGHIKY